MTITSRSSGQTVEPHLEIYPATGYTTISRAMFSRFYLSEYGPFVSKLKKDGFQVIERDPIFYGTIVGPPLGLTLPEAPEGQQSHLGAAIGILAALAIIGVLVVALATHHSPAPTGSASMAAVSSATPAIRSPLEQLIAIAKHDQSPVRRLAEHYWVPVLSSKRVGTMDPRDAVFPSQTYTGRKILQNFDYWHSRYRSALLLQSRTYSSLTSGYWIVILDKPHSTPGRVISWCKAQRLNDDNCDAALLSNHLPNGPQTFQSW
jgi:hypothetical protein